jgi:hypothetical protein
MTVDVHDPESAIAADAVLLMHDRRAWRQVGQFLQDGARIAVCAAPTPLLSRARAEQLLFRDYRDPRAGQHESADVGRHGDGEAGAAGQERLPAGDLARQDVPLTKQLEQHLAAAR